MSEQQAPYLSLGNHLKYVREQSKQSLAEVSGAVEIDEQRLSRIEAGIERPPEEILLLLISHFGIQDREAVQLWELAEYDSDLPEANVPEALAHDGGKQLIMLLAMDLRTIYSDKLEVTINSAGVTMNFTQSAGSSQTAPVARIGMSLDQAEQVLRTIEAAILQAKYNGGTKKLPPTTEQL
jgi:transcriptional regulator with XRE-family HTH domain